MVVPGLLAVLTPIAVGLAFKYVRVTPGLAAGEPLGATLIVPCLEPSPSGKQPKNTSAGWPR